MQINFSKTTYQLPDEKRAPWVDEARTALVAGGGKSESGSSAAESAWGGDTVEISEEARELQMAAEAEAETEGESGEDGKTGLSQKQDGSVGVNGASAAEKDESAANPVEQLRKQLREAQKKLREKQEKLQQAMEKMNSAKDEAAKQEAQTEVQAIQVEINQLNAQIQTLNEELRKAMGGGESGESGGPAVTAGRQWSPGGERIQVDANGIVRD